MTPKFFPTSFSISEDGMDILISNRDLLHKVNFNGEGYLKKFKAFQKNLCPFLPSLLAFTGDEGG